MPLMTTATSLPRMDAMKLFAMGLACHWYSRAISGPGDFLDGMISSA